MAKRHKFGMDFVSRIRRMQELIMANSGVDEFYEIVRLILAKYFSELAGASSLPTIEECNRLLAEHASDVAGILDGVIELQTPSEIFGEIQSIFSGVNVGSQDFNALDQAFEQLTARSYKADKGQYFTPRHVIDMCVKAIDPKPGELICDPACGSASFLKSAHSHAIAHGKGLPELYGFDYSHRACQVAKTVSLIAAGSAIRVKQLDSLKVPSYSLLDSESDTIEQAMGPAFNGFDAILTNPPFAGDVSHELFSRDYEVAGMFSRRLERDVLFIERCIKLLKPGGRLAIVLPDNKVSGKGFGELRRWIGQNSKVVGVVSLHRYTFLPYTSQKAAVLFAVKAKAAASAYDSTVHFFRSDRPGKTSNGSYLYRDGADTNLPPYVALDHDLHEAAEELRGALCNV